ncbi:MAG: zinc ribbon domain-containing protein [Planctomycetes bacterium]|nr:zinc ribbon domain-containing protein [Planctomycetota bacterium]
MPTYDYLCEACEHQFEAFQSIKDKPLKKCPACGKPKARRLIGAGSGLIFKGSGFYITDHRSSDYKQKAEAEVKAASGSSTGESKPEASPKSKDKESSPSPKTSKKPAKSA